MISFVTVDTSPTTTYRAADTTDLDSDGHTVILERLKLVLGELEVLGSVVSEFRGCNTAIGACSLQSGVMNRASTRSALSG
jgi:hypothetical protein